MILRTIAYRLLGQRAQQRMSDRFWARSMDTYAAPAAYYETRERELESLLSSLPLARRALDQGCGDGRFTAVVSRHSVEVDAYDISPALISSARTRRLGNVHFEVAEIENTPSRKYDLVICMGVTSCIAEDGKYVRVIDRLSQSVDEGGHLLLVDTVSRSRTVIKAQRHGHLGKYRDAAAYVEQVESHGLSLVAERILIDWNERLRNMMYLYQAVGIARTPTLGW